MAIKKPDLQRMLAWLSAVLTCPVCGAHYPQERTRIIDTAQNHTYDEQAVVVHSDCPTCRSTVIFNISLNGSELFSVGVASDLSANDAIKFRKQQPLNVDDVLQLHGFLQEFDGDFEKVFSNPARDI